MTPLPSGSRSSSEPSACSLIVLLSMIGALVGCKVDESLEQPVEGNLELCCKAGDTLEFSGCRTTGRCRQSEPIWLRGPASCGPVDETACADGRCCTLALPRDVPDPPRAAEPSEVEVEVPPPAPIEPMPVE